MSNSTWITMTDEQKQRHRIMEKSRRAVRRANMTDEQVNKLQEQRRNALIRRKERNLEHHTAVAKEYKRNGKGYFFSWANAIKTRALKKNIRFDLDAGFLMSIMPTHCPVLGVELQRTVGHGSGPFSPTVDRIIPDRGYIRDNVIIISKRANQIKSDASPDEIFKVAQFYSILMNDRLSQLGKKDNGNLEF